MFGLRGLSFLLLFSSLTFGKTPYGIYDTFDYFGNKENLSPQESEERQKLRKQIAEEILKGLPPSSDTKPTVLFSAGPPGSGKSTVLTRFSDSGLINIGDFAWVDPDKIKTFIPEYRKFRELDPVRAADAVHRESALIQDLVMEMAIKEKKSFVFDTTFAGREWFQSFIKDTKEKGYRMQMVRVETDPEQLALRISERAKKEGRDVPKAVVLDKIKKGQETFEATKSEFDAIAIVDNNTTPTLRSIQTKDGVNTSIGGKTLKEGIQPSEKSTYQAFRSAGFKTADDQTVDRLKDSGTVLSLDSRRSPLRSEQERIRYDQERQDEIKRSLIPPEGKDGNSKAILKITDPGIDPGSANRKRIDQILGNQKAFSMAVLDLSQFKGTPEQAQEIIGSLKDALGKTEIKGKATAKPIHTIILDNQKDQLRKLKDISLHVATDQVPVINIPDANGKTNNDGLVYAVKPALKGKNIERIAPAEVTEGANLGPDTRTYIFGQKPEGKSVELTTGNWLTGKSVETAESTGERLHVASAKSDSLTIVGADGKPFIVDNTSQDIKAQKAVPLYFDRTPPPTDDKLRLRELPSNANGGVFFDYQNRPQSEFTPDPKQLQERFSAGERGGFGALFDAHLVFDEKGNPAQGHEGPQENFDNTLRKVGNYSSSLEFFIAGGDLVDQGSNDRMHNTVEAHRKLSEALNKGNSGSPKPLYVVLGNHDEFRINQMSGDKLHGATFVGKDGKTSSKIQANDPNLAAIKEAFKKEVEAAGIPYNEADYFQPDKSTKGELIVVIDPKKKIELKRDLEALNKDGKHNIHVLSPDSQYDGFTRIEQDILDPKTGSKIGKKKIVYISHIPPLTGPNIGRILGENYKTGKTATIPPDADLIIVGDQHTEYDAVVKNFQTDKDVRIVGAGTFSKIRKEGNGSSFILADSEGRPVHVSAENSDVSLRPSGTAPKEQLAYRTPELNALSKALDTPPKETSPTSLKSPNQNSPETNDSSPPESSPSNKRNLASTELSNSHAGPDKAAGRIGCLQTAAESQGILSSGGRLSAANLAALAACGLDEASFRAYAKAGISKVGNFASGASTAIGGGLSLLAYYQGAKGSVEELQKVDFEKFKAAVNGKNPELLKEAFKDVNKLNLASSATTATEGALGFAAAAGTLAGAPTVAAIGTAGALALALPAAVLYSYKRGEDINNQYRNDLSQLDAYEKKYTDNLRNLSLARNSSRIREFRFNKLDQFPDNLCNQNIENVESKKITQEPDGTAGKTCQTRLQTVTNSFADGKFQDAAAKAPISIGFDFCKEGAAALKNGQNNPKALQKAYINFLGCREASRAASQFIQNQIYFMPGKNTKNSFVPRSIAGIVLFTNNEDFNGNNESFVERKQDLKHKGPGFTYLSQDSDSKRNFLEEKNNYNAYLSLNKNEADSLATLMKSKQANSQPKNASYCSQVFSKLEAIDIEVEGLKTACTLAVTEIEARLTAEQKQEVDQLFTKEGIKKEGVGGLYSKATDKTPSSGVPRH